MAAGNWGGCSPAGLATVDQVCPENLIGLYKARRVVLVSGVYKRPAASGFYFNSLEFFKNDQPCRLGQSGSPEKYFQRTKKTPKHSKYPVFVIVPG